MESEMAYSIDFRTKIVEVHESEGILPKQLAADFRVAEVTIRRWLKKYKETGSLEAGKPPGRPGKLKGEPKAILYQLALEYADATEAELLELLEQKTGIRVHLSAIGYHLRKMGLTFKKKTCQALELEREDVKQKTREFEHKRKGIESRRLVFLDETGCQLNMDRTHARSPRGQRAHGKRPGNTRTTLTVLGVLTSHGLVDTMTVNSGTDKLVFDSFVEHVLLKWLEPGDVVVMDNLSAHYSSKALKMIEDAGATVMFQPPYSPHLNPIEMAWSKLKNLLRAAKVRSRQDIEDVISKSLIKLGYSDAQGWFQACGYRL